MGNLTERTDLIFGSTKTYAAMFSTAFRQWRAADSHCSYNHGYDLTFSATFESRCLDDRNWVVDFGSLKSFKGWLERMFDHTTMVASDDPQIKWFVEAQERNILDLNVVKATGCEASALLVFEYLEQWLNDQQYSPRVWLAKVEVREHEANSAYVRKTNSMHD